MENKARKPVGGCSPIQYERDPSQSITLIKWSQVKYTWIAKVRLLIISLLCPLYHILSNYIVVVFRLCPKSHLTVVNFFLPQGGSTMILRQ